MSFRFLLSCLFLSCVAAVSGSLRAGTIPGVLPPNSHAFETTYGELGDEFWNWALQFPLATSPLLDDTGAFGEQGQQEKCGSWLVHSVVQSIEN